MNENAATREADSAFATSPDAIPTDIPTYDPADPYKYPALMPSSADASPRSFDPADFPQPTSKQEDWKYAPLDQLSEFFTLFTPADAVGVRAAFADGSALGGTVSFRQIRRQDFTGLVGKPSDKASAIEWQSVRRIYELDITESAAEPIVIDIAGASTADLPTDALHLAVKVAPGVHADIVLDHHGLAHLAEGVEISVGEAADVSFTSIQEWQKGSKHAASQRIRVGAHAKLRHSVVTLSGDVTRLRMDADFAGPEGFFNMLGVYFIDPSMYAEHRTMVTHNYPNCTSRVIYKGALDGAGARSAWVGNALILPTAPNTDSYELNRNLVLTPGAVAQSEPQLEIENGNIIGAGHASSVGRFDDEQLFYLESRGIPEQEARKLVVRGFFGELIGEIGIPRVSDHLMESIDRRLAHGESAMMARILQESEEH